MPGKVKVKIISGKNLPVMDRSSDTTDAYVEIKLGSTTYKTDVCRKSLHPQWNSEWYKFEMDDSELQDEPLQIRLMDHDTYSANDAIGKVYLNLNPLLLPAAGQLIKYGYNSDGNANHENAGNSVMSGWIPVYDTMHGIRGEVNIIVKVEIFSDFNRFRQSSCGVQFYYSSSVPQGYNARVVHGFVEELVVNDDPEYQWIDKIRTPRASNEARQTLFFKLSGELQRKIGVKALDLGGNAVIGYNQCFDLEGESGIVARGIGTAVTLVKAIDVPPISVEPVNEELSLSYLKFVGVNKSLRLPAMPANSSSLNTIPEYVSPFHVNLPELNITNRKYRQLAKQLSSPSQCLHSSQSNPTLTEHRPHPSLKVLLKQEDRRGTPGYGITQKIKNFKYSSQSALSKKMLVLKAKLGDSGIDEIEEECIFPQRNSPKKKNIFKRTVSESSVMAELLARSVIQAHNSLGSILEAQQEQNKESSPCREDETLEKLEPIANLLEKTLSEPLITGETRSTYSCYSSSESSSSDDDDDDDDDDNFNDLRNTDIDFETISNIVNNVELLERNNSRDNLKKQYSLPTILQKIDSEFEDMKIDFLRTDTRSEDSSTYMKDDYKRDVILDKVGEIEEYDIEDDRNIALEPVPLDFLDNGSYKDIVGSTSELFEDDKNNEEEAITSSAVNKEMDDPLSVNLSLGKSNNGEKIQTPVSKIIIPPVMFEGNVKTQGLIKTAMQTMLLEKVNIMGTYTPPTSPTFRSKSLSPIPKKAFVKPPHISKLPRVSGKILRSSTTASFSEYLRKNETVLGVPFTAIVDIKAEFLRRQTSHPCLSDVYQNQPVVVASKRTTHSLQRQYNCFSDSELHKQESFTENTLKGKIYSQDNIDTSRLKIFSLPGEAYSNESSLGDSQRSIEKNSHKRKFSLFLKNKRGDNGSKKHSSVHDVREKIPRDRRGSMISRIFHRKSKERSSEKINDAIKRKNKLARSEAVQTSESIQDIHESSPFIPSPLPLTKCTNDIVKIQLSSLPDNIKIDQGCSSSVNNKQACLTIPRNNTSPLADQTTPNQGGRNSPESKVLPSPAKLNGVPCIHRRSSDSDISITPKGNSLTGSDRSGGGAGYFVRSNVVLRSGIHDNFDMLEYPFLTMSKFPQGFILQLGGAVSARSVKLLERISNVEEPQSRDTWWSEIRMEIRSHARSLNCNAVLGYTEATSICDDICVLSASGTAAVIAYHYAEEMEDSITGLPVLQKPHLTSKDIMSTSLDRSNFEKDKTKADVVGKTLFESPEHVLTHNTSCVITHLPYDRNNVPTRTTVMKCSLCTKGKVPDLLIATIEPPDCIPIVGRGCFIESFICRPLKDLRGESIAKEISDGLPFLEYELHRLLVNKLKIKGMNTIFGLKIRISIGEKMLIGNATGTAIYLASLPSPVLPKLVSDSTSDEKKLADLQKLFHETVRQNKEIYQLKNVEDVQNGKVSDNDDSEEEHTSLDLSLGNKDCCVLEVDDPQDAELVNLLMEQRPPDGFHVVNTESVPGLEDLEIVKNLQMFTQIYRAKINSSFSLSNHFQRLLQSVYFKLRRMVPCALCDLQFRFDLPEPDEIQLCVIGMALGLGKSLRNKVKPVALLKKPDDDLIFKLDEDQSSEKSSTQSLLNAHSVKIKQRSPSKCKSISAKQRHIPYRERHGVDITPLSYVPGGKIERYLGNLNFFFIRETTSIREEGGISGFIHSFVTEVLAIVRAHITALGGNAMVAFFLTECVLNYNLHKNQIRYRPTSRGPPCTFK